MKFRQLSKREKTFFYLTIGAVILGLAYNFVVEPAIRHFTAVNKEIEEKTFLLRKQQSLILGGQDIISVYEQYKNTLDKEKDAEEVISTLFGEIEAAAAETGLKVKKVKPLASQEGREYKQALLEIDVEGDFVSLFKFINKLESGSPLLKIVSLYIASQSESSQTLRCRLSLAKIFF